MAEIENARKLFDDMLALANHPYNDWGMNIEFEYVWEKYHPVSFLDYFNLFYKECAQANNKQRVVCKEINIWNHIFQILEYYQEAWVIYLYRDPRDYVASWVKKPLFINTAYDAINSWVHEQEIIDILINVHGLKVFPVRYEDMIMDTENVISGILEYVGEHAEASCFNTNLDKGRSVSWNPYWENLAKPINSNNSGNYRKTLDSDSVKMVETIAHYHMKNLGYSPETRCDWKKKRFIGLKNRIMRKVNQLKNREHIFIKMELLQSKMTMIEERKTLAEKQFKERNNYKCG